MVVTDKEDEGDEEEEHVVASVSTIDGVRRRHSADVGTDVLVVAISISISIVVDWLHSTSGAWRIIISFFLGWPSY